MSEEYENPFAKREENPFEDPAIAAQWIKSVEGDKGLIRTKEIYPLLRSWAKRASQGSKETFSVVEIGAGQGICSDEIGNSTFSYVGIEPSLPLVERAQEKHGGENKLFAVGEAYHLPLKDKSADAVFSINVWFHLENLQRAAAELARILKPGADFLIITANPKAYARWEKFYSNTERHGKKIVGAVEIPVQPLSRNTFYAHTEEEIFSSLEAAGLFCRETHELGLLPEEGVKLFWAIQGKKNE